MARYVLKFGGSSLADTKRLYAAAEKIGAAFQAGHEVIAVLSAQGGMTDSLLAKAKEVDPNCDGRELAALLATGECCAVSLCAMALRRLGFPAIGLSGRQAELRSENRYTDARVLGLYGSRIEEELAKKQIVLVTGFQGVDDRGDITTLGRGGSDTTAVALAAFLKADRCCIYTDVDGVYDKDPKVYADAVKYPQISYDKMLFMAQNGAKVLHDRCVEMAKEHGVILQVRSSFTEDPGTVVGEIF